MPDQAPEQTSHPGNGPVTPFRGIARHTLAGAAVYGFGQMFNLGFQLLLLRALGQQEYGRVGLAHVTFLTILFVGDLGYGLFFLREPPRSDRWRMLWRLALGHRLIATTLMFAVVMLFWIVRYGTSDAGLIYLAATGMAALAALVNLSAPLLAAGRNVSGFALQQIAWPVATCCFALVWSAHMLTLSPVLLAGECVCVGYLLQAMANLVVFRSFIRNGESAASGFTLRFGDLLVPSVGRGGGRMLMDSLHISVLGFLGVINERLTAFLIENLASGFLPAYLLLGQALGGASGALAQFNRLLVAGEADGHDGPTAIYVLRGLLLAPMSLLCLVVSLTCSGDCWNVPAQWVQLALPVLFDWTIAGVGGAIAAILIGRHQERQLARALATGVAVSIAAQLSGAWLGSPDVVLWARITGGVVVLVLSSRLCGLMPSGALLVLGIAAASGSAFQAHLLPWPMAVITSALALLGALRWDARKAYQIFQARRLGSSSANPPDANQENDGAISIKRVDLMHDVLGWEIAAAGEGVKLPKGGDQEGGS
jgi:hypothetical protein